VQAVGDAVAQIQSEWISEQIEEVRLPPGVAEGTLEVT
jgi:hypothetical protein